MLYFLQSIDQFGVQQKLQIPPINPTQKSVFGGLVTLTLYSISLGYFLFQFVDWQQNNKLPKVTSLQQQINVEQKLKLQGVFAEISYFQELSHQIDPFDPQNMILQPLLVSSSSYYDQTPINATFQYRKTQEGKTQNKLLIEDIVISNSPISSQDHKYTNYQLTFTYCNPELLQDGQKCANQDLINKYFQQDNYFQILIYLEQFDPRNKQITKIPKFFVFEMMQKSYFQNMFTLKSGDLIMDDGFLFPNSNQQTYLSDLSVLTTQFDQEYAQKAYGQDIIAVLYFNLDQVKTVNMVEYPKISEILADTGSIISWILSISFIVSKYNENLSNDKAQKDIITMYYHDFNDFIIQKNWMGQIKKVNYKGKDYDLKKSIEILNKLDSIAIKKMNYLNLQNEVAKLQLILQEHLGIQQIKKYLQSQYKLESLFDKLGIPDINYQSSLNQILPQIDEQLVQNLQIQPEIINDPANNKDKTLLLELEERMEILDLQVHQNPTTSIYSSFQFPQKIND
ncbi:unnamed protein product (macronuclear) [Paramecium tetraurelia]|uniref:Peptidase A1 domain-containing protein n=1 Tax=Paramecium tetraurelia TaxID=5888 RepID=A0EDQ3_PARTE|nr:uncharacterized protein GSPATT00025764001 [Paramecium tetraurelia]CAK93420.1 unnamed protein product [Paramecium tetraurelia]|eukprot:XP_001460817.1 hypothetical protein (macronuclear) [Paramecium tetraurelia strain d4-2]